MSTTTQQAAPADASTRGAGELDTIVIGAGQTGLATAYFLRRAGRTCVVLDEHPRVGDQWRSRYASLRLNTPAKYDGLPGMRFPAPKMSFPTGRDMGDYLETYVREMGLTVEGGMRVRRVERQADGWYAVVCSGRTLTARNVVVATGAEQIPRLPTFASEIEPGIRQIHSGTYHGPEQLLPGPVLVVGAGQSGADLALECVKAGHETWLAGIVRREVPVEIDSLKARLALPILWFMANHVLTMKTPIGRKMKAQVRGGGAPLLRVKRAHLDAARVHRVESRAVGVSDGQPQLADGQVLDVANVIWCTGFQRDFDWIHPSVMGTDGWPDDEGGVVPSSPGLYFVGLLFQTGFHSMLIGGAWRDASRIASHIAARKSVASASIAT